MHQHRGSDIQRFVSLEVFDIGKFGGGIVNPCAIGCRFGFLRRKTNHWQGCSSCETTTQELAAANFDHLVTSFHGSSPIAHIFLLGRHVRRDRAAGLFAVQQIGIG